MEFGGKRPSASASARVFMSAPLSRPRRRRLRVEEVEDEEDAHAFSKMTNG